VARRPGAPLRVSLARSPRPLRLRSAVCAGKGALPQWAHDRGPPHKACGVLAPRAPARLCASPCSTLTPTRTVSLFSAGLTRAPGIPLRGTPGRRELPSRQMGPAVATALKGRWGRSWSAS